MILDKAKIRSLGLKSGDIFAVKDKVPLLSWMLQHLVDPPTDRFHFGVVWMAAEGGADRVILESAGEGRKLETILDIGLWLTIERGTVGQAVAVGRLSGLDGLDVKFYRPRYVPEELRASVPIELTRYGHDSYGYWQITKLIVGSFWEWAKIVVRERHFRKIRTEEMPFIGAEKALICTMVPDVGYSMISEPLLPLGVSATPNAYEQAVRDGVLEELHKEETDGESLA